MLKKNQLSVAVGTVALFMAGTSMAVPFNSFDPKSMAMGGAGVAVANPSTASFFNPALLSVADSRDDFTLELPVIGARVYDPDDFIDAVDNFDDDAFDALDRAITNYNSDPLNQTKAQSVTFTVDHMSTEINKISDKPLEFDGGIGLVIGIPGESFGMALTVSGIANFSGVFEYKDALTVSHLSTDFTTITNCLAPGAAADCLETASYQSGSVSIDASGNPDVTFATDTDIKSEVQVIGVAMGEVGLSFSREWSMFGTQVAIGITPKVVSLTVFDYTADADAASSNDFDGDQYTTDYSDPNLDIGLAMDHKNGWRSGLVIKNIISQDYKAMNTNNMGIEEPTGTVISLKPQARVGVSHTNDWSTIALDVDLTENEAIGDIGNNSRYVALGIELDALDWAQLRLGYRADTVNSERNVASAGIGVSPFGVHIDLGVAGNANEVGASFQLGFRF